MTDRPMGTSSAKGSPNGARKCFEYGHRNNRGEPCGANVLKGTRGCWRHAGIGRQVAKARGAVVAELDRWGLDGHRELVDPGQLLLRLITQSAARVELYSRLLREGYEAADRLRAAHDAESLIVSEVDDDDEDGEDPAIQAARLDLRRIFTTGGVAALVGYKFDADRDGNVYAVEESIRGLARLESDERDRAARFAKLGIDAGLAERQVRLAERQGAAMYAVFAAVLAKLGLSVEQQALVPGLLEAEVRSLTVGSVDEPAPVGRRAAR